MHVLLPDGALVPCVRATTFRERLKGLLGTERGFLGGGVFMLEPCCSVHTLGMAYPIDVAFLDEHGRVLHAVEGLLPGRFARAGGAVRTVERESDGSTWFRRGDLVGLFII